MSISPLSQSGRFYLFDSNERLTDEELRSNAFNFAFLHRDPLLFPEGGFRAFLKRGRETGNWETGARNFDAAFRSVREISCSIQRNGAVKDLADFFFDQQCFRELIVVTELFTQDSNETKNEYLYQIFGRLIRLGQDIIASQICVCIEDSIFRNRVLCELCYHFVSRDNYSLAGRAVDEMNDQSTIDVTLDHLCYEMMDKRCLQCVLFLLLRIYSPLLKKVHLDRLEETLKRLKFIGDYPFGETYSDEVMANLRKAKTCLRKGHLPEAIQAALHITDAKERSDLLSQILAAAREVRSSQSDRFR